MNMVAFDKTGTLTEGKPKVTDLVGIERTEEEVLRLAAALETGSSHPLATAVLRRAEGMALPHVDAARALGGKGVLGMVDGVGLFLGSVRTARAIGSVDAALERRVRAFTEEGKTVAVLMAGTAVAGLIAMRDEPRPDARAGLPALADEGCARSC